MCGECKRNRGNGVWASRSRGVGSRKREADTYHFDTNACYDVTRSASHYRANVGADARYPCARVEWSLDATLTLVGPTNRQQMATPIVVGPLSFRLQPFQLFSHARKFGLCLCRSGLGFLSSRCSALGTGLGFCRACFRTNSPFLSRWNHVPLSIVPA